MFFYIGHTHTHVYPEWSELFHVKKIGWKCTTAILNQRNYNDVCNTVSQARIP